jgi:hypothetical protein
MYNETNERNPMDQSPPQFPLSAIHPAFYQPTYLFTHPVIILPQMLVVMTFPSNEHFKMVDTSQKG